MFRDYIMPSQLNVLSSINEGYYSRGVCLLMAPLFGRVIQRGGGRPELVFFKRGPLGEEVHKLEGLLVLRDDRLKALFLSNLTFFTISKWPNYLSLNKKMSNM